MYGVVLAAGRSTRMGRAKALLESEGRTLLARAADSLGQGGCLGVFVVVPAAAPDVRAAARQAGTAIIAPDDPDAEPLDSLRIGLAALPADAVAAVVLPVDCPFVRPATVSRLIERVLRADAVAVVPVWRGRDGHPVALHRRLFAHIARERPAGGLRTLLAREPRVERFAVEDEAVTFDLDTPAEAERRGVRT